MNKKIKHFDKRILFPILHLVLSFVYERFALIFNDLDAVGFSISMNDAIPRTFEQIMCYVISKVMALVIIFLLWGLVFKIKDGMSKETLIVFGAILAFSLVAAVIQWPDDFICGGDNYIPYSFALRILPEYWHSIYLSCLFTASFMVFPHAVSITLLQVTSFVVAIGYLYNRILTSEKFSHVKWIRFLTLLMFIFRDSFSVSTNAERAEYNTGFLLLFVSIIVMDMIEMKKRSFSSLLKLLVLSAFLAVFRSEGLIVGILGFLALLFVVYRPDLKKGALLVFALLLCVVIFKLPGKVGEIKYYGSDYSIINTFPTLKNILNSKEANLSFATFEEDIKALEAVTPVSLIKEYGTDGYRFYNYANGRVDFNQSMAGSDASKAFMAAYKDLVIHNIPIYLKTQWYMLLHALGTGVSEYEVAYTGTHTEIDFYGRDLWEVGTYDIINIPGRYTWINNGFRNKLATVLTMLRVKYIDMLNNSKIYSGFIVAEFLISVFMAINELIRVCRKKFDNMGLWLSTIILDGYFVLVALVMPAGANMYFHAYIYCMFAVELLYFARRQHSLF